MPQIPLYKRSEVQTSETGGVMASGDSAYGELARLGGQISQVALAYKEKKEQLRSEADHSDYAIRLKTLKSNIDSGVNQALMSGVAYSDIQKEVVNPLLQQFSDDTAKRNYMKSSLSDINNRWSIDRIGISQKYQNEVEQMELNDYVSRISMEATTLMQEGNLEEADAKWNIVSGVVGEAKANEMRSSALYKIQYNEMEGMENAYLSGELDTDSYLKYLQERSASAGDISLRSMAISRENNLYRKEATKSAQAFKPFITAVEKGTLDDATNRLLKESMTPEMYDNAVNIMQKSLVRKSTSNEDALKIVNIMSKYEKGEISITKAFESINDTNSDLAFQGIAWLMNSIGQDVQDGKEVYAYKKLFKEERIKSGGRMGEFLNKLTNVITPDTGSDDLKAILQSGTKYIQENPNATQEEFDSAMSVILKTQAKSKARMLFENSMRYGTAYGIASNIFSSKDNETKSKQSPIKEVRMQDPTTGKIGVFNADTKEFIRWED